MLEKENKYIYAFDDILTFCQTLNVSYEHEFIFVLHNMTRL